MTFVAHIRMLIKTCSRVYQDDLMLKNKKDVFKYLDIFLKLIAQLFPEDTTPPHALPMIQDYVWFYFWEYIKKLFVTLTFLPCSCVWFESNCPHFAINLFNDTSINGRQYTSKYYFSSFGLILYQRANFCHIITGIFLVLTLVLYALTSWFIFRSFTGNLNSCQVQWNL